MYKELSRIHLRICSIIVISFFWGDCDRCFDAVSETTLDECLCNSAKKKKTKTKTFFLKD